VRKAYEIFPGVGVTRPSWDPVATLVAVRGPSALFTAVTGTNAYDASTGANTFTSSPTGNHSYLVQAVSDAQLRTTIEDLMVQTPAHSSGPIASWRLDEGSGSMAADTSGHGHVGTLVSGPIWTTGQVNGALSFDGVAAHVEAPDNPNFRFAANQSFSLVTWVNVPSLPGRWSGIVTKSRDQAPGYGIWLDPSNRWTFGGNDGMTFSNVYGNVATTGWHYVAVVQDGAANTRTLYVDGMVQGTGQASVANGPGSLWIGGSDIGGYFGGLVDDVRLYSQPLTTAEVQALP